MSPPIFPQHIYPIGELPDGTFIAEVGARGFQYSRDLPGFDDLDLPELNFNDDEPDTIPNPPLWAPDVDDTIPAPPPVPEDDEGPLTLRPKEIEKQPWYRRITWWRNAA